MPAKVSAEAVIALLAISTIVVQTGTSRPILSRNWLIWDHWSSSLRSRVASRFSWTLTFLIMGVAVGCLNAWYWVKRARQDIIKD